MLSSFQEMGESPVLGIISSFENAIEENPDITVAEVLESPDMVAEIENSLGRELTQAEGEQLQFIIEAEGYSDMQAKEYLENPEFLAMLMEQKQ